jgi:AcrR family transcriptional regulator
MAAVPSPVNKPDSRPYRSTVRSEGARRTRRTVLASAMTLFSEQGYARTTLVEIAAAAGVSVETVYKTFGSKRALLRELADVTVGGDDEDIPVLERADPQALRNEPDQRRQLAMFAAGIAVQLERIRPLDDVLRSAAAVDPEVAALRNDLQLRQRRGAMTAIAGWVAARGPLREGVDGPALLWTLASPEVHHLLRVGWGWSPAEYEDWLRTTLTAAMLP